MPGFLEKWFPFTCESEETRRAMSRLLPAISTNTIMLPQTKPIVNIQINGKLSWTQIWRTCKTNVEFRAIGIQERLLVALSMLEQTDAQMNWQTNSNKIMMIYGEKYVLCLDIASKSEQQTVIDLNRIPSVDYSAPEVNPYDFVDTKRVVTLGVSMFTLGFIVGLWMKTR